MPNFAQIQIIGHIGKVDELKFISNGSVPVLRFSVCVNTGYGDKKTPTWYECNYYGKNAQGVAPYILKGNAICVCGEPSIRKWESETSGKSGFTAEIRVEKLTLIGGEKTARTSTETGQGDVSDAPATDDGSDVPF